MLSDLRDSVRLPCRCATFACAVAIHRPSASCLLLSSLQCLYRTSEVRSTPSAFDAPLATLHCDSNADLASCHALNLLTLVRARVQAGGHGDQGGPPRRRAGGYEEDVVAQASSPAREEPCFNGSGSGSFMYDRHRGDNAIALSAVASRALARDCVTERRRAG